MAVKSTKIYLSGGGVCFELERDDAGRRSFSAHHWSGDHRGGYWLPSAQLSKMTDATVEALISDFREVIAELEAMRGADR